MHCESEVVANAAFLKGKLVAGQALVSPTIEMYIAGSFSGNPVVITKTLQLSFRKHGHKHRLDAIPEYDTTERQKDSYPVYDSQVSFLIASDSTLNLISFCFSTEIIQQGSFTSPLLHKKIFSLACNVSCTVTYFFKIQTVPFCCIELKILSKKFHVVA